MVAPHFGCASCAQGALRSLTCQPSYCWELHVGHELWAHQLVAAGLGWSPAFTWFQSPGVSAAAIHPSTPPLPFQLDSAAGEKREQTAVVLSPWALDLVKAGAGWCCQSSLFPCWIWGWRRRADSAPPLGSRALGKQGLQWGPVPTRRWAQRVQECGAVFTVHASCCQQWCGCTPLAMILDMAVVIKSPIRSLLTQWPDVKPECKASIMLAKVMCWRLVKPVFSVIYLPNFTLPTPKWNIGFRKQYYTYNYYIVRMCMACIANGIIAMDWKEKEKGIRKGAKYCSSFWASVKKIILYLSTSNVHVHLYTVI